MFATENKAGDGFEKVVLKDPNSGTYVEVLPACGAILHSFNVLHNGSSINIIDGYESQADFRTNVTNKGFKGCKLSPFACRIESATYHFGEKNFVIEKFPMLEGAVGSLFGQD